MRIEEVVVNNFGSFYGMQKFQVGNRGLMFVEGKNLDVPMMTSNGAGKSTIFDAIDWCLFGKVPKGDDADSVINAQAGKECSVTVTVVDGEDSFVVVRFRNYSKLAAFTPYGPQYYGAGLYVATNGMKGSKATAKMDMDETQKYVNELLGLDRDVFHAAVYWAQNDTFDFADATDAKRKEILSKIIPELDMVDQLTNKLGPQLDACRASVQKNRDALQEHEIRVAVLEAKDYDKLKAEWEKIKGHQLKAAKKDYAAAKGQQGEAKALLAQCAGKEEELQKHLAKEPKPPTDEKRAQLVAEVSQAQNTMASMKASVDSTEQYLNDMLSPAAPGVCPTCFTPLEKASGHLEAKRVEMKSSLTQYKQYYQQAVESYEKAVQALAEYNKGFEEAQAAYYAEFNAWALKKSGLETTLPHIGALKFEIDNLGAQMLHHQAKIDEIEAQPWSLQEEYDEHAKKLQFHRDLMKAADHDLAHDLHVLKILNFWREAFTSKGMKSFILDSRLQDMTDAANEWVKRLTGGTCWIRFESQTSKKKGGFSEKLNIRVFRHSPNGGIVERNYKSWSGGEKKRVSLGIDHGLSKLIAERATKPWDQLFIDESFRQHLDSGGREAVFQLLEQLALEKSSIFVVDHDHEMAAQFDKKIVVTIQNERSTIQDPEYPETWVGKKPEDKQLDVLELIAGPVQPAS